MLGAPAVVPAVPGATVANPNPAAVPNGEELVQVEYVGADAANVIRDLEKWVGNGRHYIMGNAPLGTINFHLSERVPKSELNKR